MLLANKTARVTAYTASDFYYYHSVSPLSLIMGQFVIQSFRNDILVLVPPQCNDSGPKNNLIEFFLVLMGGYGVSTKIVLYQRLMFWYTYLVGLDIHKRAGDQKFYVNLC